MDLLIMPRSPGNPLSLGDAVAAGVQERLTNDDQADKRRSRSPCRFPFSLASEGNGLVFISGMPALDAGGTFVAGTFEEEADRAWARIVSIAAASGCSPGDFLYVQVLLADIGNYADINTWWQKQFPDLAKAPARLTFQAGALPFGARSNFRRWLQPLTQPGDVARSHARRRRRQGYFQRTATAQPP
jgi:2-iminobutanoate/2-iminopropanoate deaminase